MKKLITLVMLGIFAVMNVNAAEQTLWEGDYNVSWKLSDGDEHREWKGLGKDDFAAMEVGQKLYFYFSVTDDSYHKYNFDNWSWQALPGHEAEHAETFGFSEDTKVEFELTQAIKDEIAANGFAIHGHGFHVTKVTKEYTITDIAPKLLWKGSKEITGYAAGDGLHLNFKTLDITTACNMYFLVEVNGTGDLRFTRNNNGWADWPAVGTNLCTGHIDANNIIKVELPQDFVTAVIEGEDDGCWHEIVIWGNNLTIKAIATTWETLLCPVTTDALGYATYGNSYTLALDLLPEGLKAFTATLDGATLSFAKKTEAVGPGTGLLIQGVPNTTYYLPAKTDGTGPAYNDLSANMSANKLADLWKDKAENYVFLMKKNATGTGNIEFKRLTNTEFVVPANKAYVQVSPSVFTTSAARELRISFGEGEVTGISDATLLNINEVIKNNNVYDLSGRCVAKPTKGLYIVNGKKVVIK